MKPVWGMSFEMGLYLAVLAGIAVLARRNFGSSERWAGLPGYLLTLGLTLFLATWVNLLFYVIFGWGKIYLAASWVAVATAAVLAWKCRGRDGLKRGPWWRAEEWRFSPWFGFLAVVVLSRFWFGLRADTLGQVWCNFNFVDTAFHLSVTNSLLESPRFPPVDLDLAPFPLKYHFLADFLSAHLVRLGADPLAAMAAMNFVSGAVMVGSLWIFFSRVLRLPPPWVFLAAVVLLFLSLPLVNLIHYYALKPSYMEGGDFIRGVLRFSFFNFESMQGNLLEPQRGLLFSVPVILWILLTTFDADPNEEPQVQARRTWVSFAGVCLLPLAHIVAFAVLGLCLVPALWRQARHWRAGVPIWGPALMLGSLQLIYLFIYGPPLNEQFTGSDLGSALAVDRFAMLPGWSRRAVFWFFANGDFFGWGALALLVALVGYVWRRRRGADLGGELLVRWRWYGAVCLLCFLFINFYRYSYDWGDSNKFIFFVNLGLTLVIVHEVARWRTGAWRDAARTLWIFFAALCLAPPAYEFYNEVVAAPHGKILLFQQHGLEASIWLRDAAGPDDLVLTAADNTFHFVTALAGAPTLAGLYSGSNPYRQPGRAEEIRRVYEDGELSLLSSLGVRYVSLSRAERRRYRIHPIWGQLVAKGTGVVFNSGRPDEFDAVYIFEAAKLSAFAAR
jgi:hypothetical protein